jgi:hypothetical protein
MRVPRRPVVACTAVPISDLTSILAPAPFPLPAPLALALPVPRTPAVVVTAVVARPAPAPAPCPVPVIHPVPIPVLILAPTSASASLLHSVPPGYHPAARPRRLAPLRPRRRPVVLSYRRLLPVPAPGPRPPARPALALNGLHLLVVAHRLPRLLRQNRASKQSHVTKVRPPAAQGELRRAVRVWQDGPHRPRLSSGGGHHTSGREAATARTHSRSVHFPSSTAAPLASAVAPASAMAASLASCARSRAHSRSAARVTASAMQGGGRRVHAWAVRRGADAAHAAVARQLSQRSATADMGQPRYNSKAGKFTAPDPQRDFRAYHRRCAEALVLLAMHGKELPTCAPSHPQLIQVKAHERRRHRRLAALAEASGRHSPLTRPS